MRALHAHRVGVHARRLQVPVLREDVDAVRRRRGDRIHRGLGIVGRAQAGTLAEEHRRRFARQHQRIAGAEVARHAERAAGVGAGVGREPVDALLVVAEGVAGANDRLLGIAEERLQPAALHVRPPRHAHVRREVEPVGLVRRDARHRSGRRPGSTCPTGACGLKMLQPRSPGPSPVPEMPQMSSIVASDHVSSAGVKGLCRSQRTPPERVRAGVARH